MRIILSRTDSIGDVVLTLPMAGVLKQSFPGCTILFLGRNYTRPVIEACEHIDQFYSWDVISGLRDQKARISFFSDLHADVIIHVFPVREICMLAKQAGIPKRIATSRRFFTMFSCNRLLYIPRKNSSLHESQLNLRMLKGVGINREFSLDDIPGLYGLTGVKEDQTLVTHHASRVTDKFTLLLHPKSKGSAREWGLDNYSTLIGLLPPEKFNILITGTKDEGAQMQPFLQKHQGRIKDMTGKLTLTQLMALIKSSGAMVAASTGPLHLAAALGIRAIGLYAPMRPIFPQRWAPLGKNATFLVLDKTCNKCRKTLDCTCIRAITPEAVAEKLLDLLK